MGVELARSRNVKLISFTLLACVITLLSSFSPAVAGTANTRTSLPTARPRVLAHGRWPKPQRLDRAPMGRGASLPEKTRAAAVGAYKAAVLKDKPLAYWRLDELKGPTAADSSGHNVAARYGAIGGFQRPGALVGDPDTGILAATSQAITAPASTFPASANARTIEFWGTAASCCGQVGVSYGNLAAGNGFSAVYDNGSNQLTVSDGNSSDNVTVSQPYSLSDGQWHLFDFTFHSSQVIIYVDGVAVGSGTLAGLTTDTSGNLTAGSPGNLDEVSVYPTALSAARIAAHWTAGSSAAAACAAAPTGRYPAAVLADAPVSYYRADDIVTNPTGRVAYDSSGHCNNGSLRYTNSSATGAVVGDSDAATAGGFSATAASLPAGSTARTVEFWSAVSACCGTFGVSYGNLAAGNGFSFTYGNGNGQLTLSDGNSPKQVTVNQPYQLSDGNWHLFDLVYTGTTATFYVDGAAVGAGYESPAWPPAPASGSRRVLNIWTRSRCIRRH